MGCVWGIPSLSPLSSLVNMYEHTYIHYLDPEIKAGGGEAVSKNNFFRVFGPQFGLKIRGGGGPPWAPPRDPPLCQIPKRVWEAMVIKKGLYEILKITLRSR